MFANSYDISITTFCYFFFDCGYLEVAMYCFVGNIPRYISIKDLSVFDWKCRSISMLELLAVRHSWIP